MDKNERLNLIKEILNFKAGDNEEELKRSSDSWIERRFRHLNKSLETA